MAGVRFRNVKGNIAIARKFFKENSLSEKLKEDTFEILYSENAAEIQPWMAGVRFRNVKSENIAIARKFFKENSLSEKLKEDTFEIREWLVENVRGMGYKESSHFLRNIGLGENIAILDRHILKNLVVTVFTRPILSSV